MGMATNGCFNFLLHPAGDDSPSANRQLRKQDLVLANGVPEGNCGLGGE